MAADDVHEKRRVAWKTIEEYFFNVKTYGAVGDGVHDDSVAIQEALDDAYLATTGGQRGRVYMPRGTYSIGTTQLLMPNKVTLYGDGKDSSRTRGTVIVYDGVEDAIHASNPVSVLGDINSTDADYSVENLWIHCTVKTAKKASFADTAGTYGRLVNVGTSGNAIGVTCDQSELFLLDHCQFEVPTGGTAGVWLVNGAIRTPSALTFYTNNITFRDCQWDSQGDGVGVADDGGVIRQYEGHCNFNGLNVHIRMTDASGVRIFGEFEEPTTTSIYFATTMVHGSGGGASDSVKIGAGTFFSTGSPIALITFDPASVYTLSTECVHFNNANAAGSPFSGLAAGAIDYSGKHNRQVGASTASVGNTYNVATTFTPAWSSASNPQPSLGAGGTLTGTAVRNGNSVDVTIAWTPGAATTFGTGEWAFSMPYTHISTESAIGSCKGFRSGVSYVAGAAEVLPSAAAIACFTNGAVTAVAPTVPHTWANGDHLRMQVTVRTATTF